MRVPELQNSHPDLYEREPRPRMSGAENASNSKCRLFYMHYSWGSHFGPGFGFLEKRMGKKSRAKMRVPELQNSHPYLYEREPRPRMISMGKVEN
jgi:hypothetical protein